ncbi:MAG: hypothetical protein KAJ51_11665, partial [Thermoplasmata archaeon]|nr:hypothetical protein [Thermoplasmata archaeon]
MKKNSNRLNVNMQKYLVSVCVILLLGSVIGMNGITFGDANNSRAQGGPEPLIKPLAPTIDLNTLPAYPHQNLTIYGAAPQDVSGESIASG